MQKFIVTQDHPNGLLVDMTQDEISSLQADVEADAEYMQANGYRYARERAYPTMAEQLDMQYWDSVNGTTVWADTIAAVKAANPKPE
jgi:hypothetical protein